MSLYEARVIAQKNPASPTPSVLFLLANSAMPSSIRVDDATVKEGWVTIMQGARNRRANYW